MGTIIEKVDNLPKPAKVKQLEEIETPANAALKRTKTRTIVKMIGKKRVEQEVEASGTSSDESSSDDSDDSFGTDPSQRSESDRRAPAIPTVPLLNLHASNSA